MGSSGGYTKNVWSDFIASNTQVLGKKLEYRKFKYLDVFYQDIKKKYSFTYLLSCSLSSLTLLAVSKTYINDFL
jgi:hypothetical protein